MTAKLEAGALALVLVGTTAVVFWQQREIKRLMTEGAALRDEIRQAASAREENQRLAAQLKASVESAPADQRELMRLRAQSSRLRQLEQENAQLNAERQAQQAVAPPELPQASQATDVKASTPPAGVTDLGVVELSESTPVRLELGAGKQCIVTATGLPDGNLQMVFTSESEIDGVPVQSNQTLTLTLTPGKQMAAVINGVEVALTPTLKTR